MNRWEMAMADRFMQKVIIIKAVIDHQTESVWRGLWSVVNYQVSRFFFKTARVAFSLGMVVFVPILKQGV